MGPSVRQVVRALQEGKTIALLGDQSGPRESVFIEFFGRPAATHRGPAAFSLRNGTPIVMIFLVRREDGTYDALFEEVDRSGLTGPSEENIVELTRRHTALLEKYVRLYPDHWLWMHKRWKHTAYFEQQVAGEVAEQQVGRE
jgi:KDO2-lipid IV(A) lauroyltransferase